jgi:tetratricopeptide (TPR) repeat protein
MLCVAVGEHGGDQPMSTEPGPGDPVAVFAAEHATVPVSRTTAAAVGGLEEADLDPLVRELCQVNLVEAHADRLVLHDLTRVFAGMLARTEDSGPERFSAERRLIFRNLGLLHRRAGRLPEALAAYESALEAGRCSPARDWLSASAQTNLGRAYLEAGDLDRAEHAYRTAIELSQETGDRMRKGGRWRGWPTCSTAVAGAPPRRTPSKRPST